MTYCVGLYLSDGLVMLSDTRSNAGVDHIATFSKMHVFEIPGERVLVLLTAGNLATSQSVANMLKDGITGKDGEAETMFSVGTMFRAAQLAGEAVRRVYQVDAPILEAQHISFDISLLLAGQIRGGEHRLYQSELVECKKRAVAETMRARIAHGLLQRVDHAKRNASHREAVRER